MRDTYTFKQVGKSIFIHCLIVASLAIWSLIAAFVYVGVVGVLFLVLERPLFETANEGEEG